ncbi:ribonuclease H-like domain-containing protein [Tanacetum coccineum]|uniref:Ribonuclease H-like domain-containing protein n=1 Tax=Tanacetum coccineum TaxID=301880 RepID=A0ABQ5EG58_9ASTR
MAVKDDIVKTSGDTKIIGSSFDLSLSFADSIYLHPNDTSGSPIVTIKLIGTEIYKMWSIAMKFALRNLNKLGFIDGTCKRDDKHVALANQWDMCNSVVMIVILSCRKLPPLPKRANDEGRVPSNDDGIELSPDIHGNDDSGATSMDENNTHPEGTVPNEIDFVNDLYENLEFNSEVVDLPVHTVRMSSRQTKLPTSFNDFVIEGKVIHGVEKVVNYKPKREIKLFESRKNGNYTLRRRNGFSWSDFSAGKSVVQLWDSFGLGLDFEDDEYDHGSEIAIWDLDKDLKISSGRRCAVMGAAESVVLTAEMSRSSRGVVYWVMISAPLSGLCCLSGPQILRRLGWMKIEE